MKFVRGTVQIEVRIMESELMSSHGFNASDIAEDFQDTKSTNEIIYIQGGRWSNQPMILERNHFSNIYLWSWIFEYECVLQGRNIASETLFNTIMESANAMVVYSDSHSAIKLAKNEPTNHRNNHIDISFHFLWDDIPQKGEQQEYKPTNEMVNDILTKPFGGVVSDRLVKLMRM